MEKKEFKFQVTQDSKKDLTTVKFVGDIGYVETVENDDLLMGLLDGHLGNIVFDITEIEYWDKKTVSLILMRISGGTGICFEYEDGDAYDVVKEFLEEEEKKPCVLN